ncbi:hypothetical protein [Streptomyces aidingensis]|uniref:Uncharacterized protein n=1 Tax=Streptomyces aidingensis TaxID=910347 RepID=A0A1I1PIX0_9ACTN|nr:hypothetical protein [Streptomyces aidingensis]SFC87737.1 hypothetical protein SAMN05421773_10716 [Streptomyces aidingensis]SFD09769.1 hypothetical protein SAMN05421773_109219 [Streptomyces aidingensis]
MRGSRFDYRMRITSAAPADIVTRMTAQAIAEENTPTSRAPSSTSTPG